MPPRGVEAEQVCFREPRTSFPRNFESTYPSREDIHLPWDLLSSQGKFQGSQIRLLLTIKQKLEKVVPDQPKNSTPVHLRTRQVLADFPILKGQGQPFVAPQADSKDA